MSKEDIDRDWVDVIPPKDMPMHYVDPIDKVTRREAESFLKPEHKEFLTQISRINSSERKYLTRQLKLFWSRLQRQHRSDNLASFWGISLALWAMFSVAILYPALSAEGFSIGVILFLGILGVLILSTFALTIDHLRSSPIQRPISRNYTVHGPLGSAYKSHHADRVLMANINRSMKEAREEAFTEACDHEPWKSEGNYLFCPECGHVIKENAVRVNNE